MKEVDCKHSIDFLEGYECCFCGAPDFEDEE
jgi:hypothetical protein